MRLIKINKITRANKTSNYTREKYNCISLGNGLSCYFSSYTNATKFIAETNRMLNTTALELNRIYIEVWTEQRKIFFSYHDVFMHSYKLREYPVMIEKAFNLMMTRSHWINGNSFTFSYFSNIIEWLGAWCDELMKYMQTKNLYATVDVFIPLKERIKYIEEKINKWGSEYTKAPPCPYDLSGKVPFSSVDRKKK